MIALNDRMVSDDKPRHAQLPRASHHARAFAPRRIIHIGAQPRPARLMAKRDFEPVQNFFIAAMHSPWN
ncbi:hypothetical protein [Caballeronia terrestris]|jgi:hypothetical protein|uniref:hypothetical protein n=1 Tax=Caballeronia terrestris TaxID=1226301 RepID=UPI000B3E5C44|nr:hypothetical protein [Caballeronia terrestris]